MESKIRGRVDVLKSELLGALKNNDLKTALSSRGEGVRELRNLEGKRSEATAKLNGLGKKRMEVLEGPLEGMPKRLSELAAEKTGLEEYIDIIDGRISTAETRIEEGNLDAKRRAHGIVENIRQRLCGELDSKLRDVIEVEILSWDRAVREVFNDPKMPSGHDIQSLYLQFNRVVEGHMMPPH